jgi:amino acid adenylation domain-containing protein
MNQSLAGYRISPQQKRLWSLQQLDGGLPYQSSCDVRIDGTLDSARLKAAIEAAIAKHEILRTTFGLLPGMSLPVQIIREGGLLWTESCNYKVGENDEMNAASPADEMVDFDLFHGPLLSARLTSFSDGSHLLTFKAPALLIDMIGLNNLVKETVRAYDHSLPEAGGQGEVDQYADLAEWMNNLIEIEENERGREYWHGIKERLDSHTIIEIDGRTPSQFSLRSLSCQLDAGLFAEINNLAGTWSSPRTFLITCWQLVLQKLALVGASCVGVEHDCRQYGNLRNAVGLFSRYLPIFHRFDPHCSFRDVWRTMEDELARAHKWQSCFDWKQMIDDGPPAFLPYCFAYTELAELWQAGDTAFTILDQESRFDRFRLGLNCLISNGSCRTVFHWDSAHFSREQVERLADSFQTLLQCALQHPDVRLGELSAVGPKERRRLLQEFNHTRVDFRPGRLLHSWFEQQAERTPQSVAVLDDRCSLSYSELNRQANSLAHRLRSLGVGPGSLVAICLERSVEMACALLGTLKAGAAYVPLDPSYPQDRLAFMLEDCKAQVVLAQAGVSDRLGKLPKQVLYLDKDWRQEGESNHNPDIAAGAENAAYVIYTSGSTGRPKGVVISHRAICNHMEWLQHQFPISAQDRVLQKTPFSFDASVWEFYAPWMVGGQLVMARPGAHQDSSSLVRILEQQQISILQVVPSLLRMLIGESDLDRCRWLHHIFCGGEALMVELAEKLSVRLPGSNIHNLYGPTEAAIDATCWSYRQGDGDMAVPIGRPVANTQIYVLEGLQLAPIGVRGELHIGGEGLAQGYLGRPGLTAERFIPDPFAERPGTRMYRTGDWACWQPDGSLQFLGRVDHQVKMRGFRIELGEIENALRRRAEIKDAAIIVREDQPGNQQLVAYVVGQPGAALRETELRRDLKSWLPDHMLPGPIVIMEALPLTPNGKVDRRALPEPEIRSRASEPLLRTPIEEILAGIWSHILQLPEVGMNDNFFELGGHSLLATQVVSRVREALAIELQLRTLFENPTIALLAAALKKAASPNFAPPPLAASDRNGLLPLSFAQQRLWFIDHLEPNSSPTCPTAVHLQGYLNIGALRRSLSELVRRHETLRTSFPVRDGEPVQQIAAPAPIRLPLVNLEGMGESGWSVARELAQAEAGRPFDLARGPLLRTTLLRLDADNHVMLLTMHHIVSDGWSVGVLIREFTALYEAYRRGEPSPLPELEIQYADYAVWQRQWLQGEALEAQLGYWRRQLAGVPMLELPTDYPRPAVSTSRGASVPFMLSRDLAEKLRGLSRRENVSLFMTLLAGFQAVLCRWSGQEDFVIGTDIANRTWKETEGLIGFFVNQLVLRTSLSGDPSFQHLLARVRETTLMAYAHQDLPFDRLVEALNPPREASRTPLFQVKFVLQNAPTQPLAISGLSLKPLDLKRDSAKFDLLFNLAEMEEGIAGTLDYSTDLFAGQKIVYLLERYYFILEKVADAPETRLSELYSNLAIQERHQQEEMEEQRRAALFMKLKQTKPAMVTVPPGTLSESEAVQR